MRQIPNLLTLANLFCGCAAVVATLNYRWSDAFWLFIAAGVFDFGDGLAARMLRVSSPVGKELDSLADMVSFGFLPGAIFFVLLDFPHGTSTDELQMYFPAYLGFVFTLAAAYRLAKFNLDTRQSEEFIGLATPAATGMAVGLLMWFDTEAYYIDLLHQAWFLLFVVGLLSFLMLSQLRFFAFKLKSLGWRGNEIRYTFAAVSIAGLIFFGKLAIAPLVGGYILLNLVLNIFRKRANSPPPTSE